MSNQPYEGHDPQQSYDPYAQRRAAAWSAQAGQAGQAQAGHGYAEPSAASAAEQAQQWQGRTWESQSQPRITPEAGAAETSYLPPVPGQAAQQQASGTAQPLPEPAEAAADPGYGPPTVGGNPRLTDAQRARAEGRSPVIEPGAQPAVLTALLGLLLAGGAALGPYGLLLPVVALQAVTAAGWFRLNGMWPARQGIALAFLGALVADVAVLAAGRDDGVVAILGTLGVWVLLTLVL
jgi:hypothetical protein